MIYGKNERNKFFGFKNSELVYCSRPNYRDFMIALEFDPDVISYYQPELEFVFSPDEDDSPALRIDFCVARSGQISEFVHLHEEPVDPVLLPQAIGYAAGLGSEFRAVKISEISQDPRRKNLRKIWRHARRDLKNIHLAYLDRFFKSEVFPTVGALQDFLKANGFQPNLAYTLFFHQAALVNLDDFPLTVDTAILPNKQLRTNCLDKPLEQYSYLEIWQSFEPDENF